MDFNAILDTVMNKLVDLITKIDVTEILNKIIDLVMGFINKGEFDYNLLFVYNQNGQWQRRLSLLFYIFNPNRRKNAYPCIDIKAKIC